MITVTYVSLFITVLFRGMPCMWTSRHRLMLVGSLSYKPFSGRKTLEALAPWALGQMPAWRLHRLLKAAYWEVHLLVACWIQEALNTLPPPKDGNLFLVGDSSEQPKWGTQNSLAQKGHKNEHHPYRYRNNGSK